MIDRNLGPANEEFTFRPPRDADELESLLRLRYRVFRGGNLRRLVRPSVAGIDLDPWDRFSSHFGLFANRCARQQAVGYLRVVEGRPTTHASLVEDIAGSLPDSTAFLAPEPPVPFPLLLYFPDADAVREAVAEIRQAGGDIVEPSRLAMDPALSSMRLSRRIIMSAIAIYFFHLRCSHAMGCCDHERIGFYELFGFRQLPGTVVGDFLGIGERSCCVMGSRAAVPAKVVGRLQEMAERYAETNTIPNGSGSGRDRALQTGADERKASCLSTSTF